MTKRRGPYHKREAKKRSERVLTTLTPSELERLDRRAEDMHLSRSSCIRIMLLDKLPP